MYVNAFCRRSARCLDVLSFLPFGIMRSYPGFCRRKQLEYNSGLTHRRRAGHPRANRRTSDRPSLRGATELLARHHVLPHISIHAPLAGCDPCIRIPADRRGYFNPRTPYGVRLCGAFFQPFFERFQSTHPLRGATTSRRNMASTGHFNPRTPCGVRLMEYKSSSSSMVFQSTHPLRGATIKGRFCRIDSQHFNPRTPCGVRPV